MIVTSGKHYLALVLTKQCREELLRLYPPRYKLVKCKHITIQYDIWPDQVERLQKFVSCYPEFTAARLIRTNCLDVLEVFGNSTPFRPLGGCFHVTLSHTEERSSSDSNDVLHFVHESWRYDEDDHRIAEFHEQYGELEIVRINQDRPLRLSGYMELVPHPVQAEDVYAASG
jgi:hypothetical protein